MRRTRHVWIGAELDTRKALAREMLRDQAAEEGYAADMSTFREESIDSSGAQYAVDCDPLPLASGAREE